jgi:hypothetical protein
MPAPSRQRIKKPTVLRVYYRLNDHLASVSTHMCSHCYTNGNALIVEGDVAKHIREDICIDMSQQALKNIVEDLQDHGLAKVTTIRDNLYKLELLQKQKERAS